MERPERIVLFMIGAFTNRMAAVLWVILVLSIFTVADRIILTYRELRDTQRGDGMKRDRHAARPRPLERVLLDLRARHLAVRRHGDRDPRVRLADAARLAERSDGVAAPGPIGWLIDAAEVVVATPVPVREPRSLEWGLTLHASGSRPADRYRASSCPGGQRPAALAAASRFRRTRVSALHDGRRAARIRHHHQRRLLRSSRPCCAVDRLQARPYSAVRPRASSARA